MKIIKWKVTEITHKEYSRADLYSEVLVFIILSTSVS